MKRLKAWQIVVLCVTIIVVGGGAYGIYAWVSGPSTASSDTSNVQLSTVQYGNLSNTVSASGSIAFSTRKKLSFGGSGTVAVLDVSVGDTVKNGQVLAKLDDASIVNLEKVVTQAQISLNAAEDNLEKARYSYDDTDLANAKAAVANAQQVLADAQFKAPLDVADAEYSAWKAESAYWTAYNRLLLGQIDYREVDKAKRDWDRAAYNLESAKRNSAESVSSAETALSDAQEHLDEVRVNAGDPLTIELKTLERDAAQNALEAARQNLAAASIVSPMDGVVSVVNVTEGQAVAPSTVVVELLDPTVIDLNAILDEIDVPQVQVGQKAAISLSSLSDVTFSGTVTYLAQSGTTQQGVVTYPVTIRVTAQDGVTLRAGMSGTADIVVQEASNVLVVPDSAVRGTTINPVVEVMANGQIEQRSVKLGMSDGTRSEVISGLQEGEQVVLRTTTSSSSSSSIRMPQTTIVTGFPGGGNSQGIFIEPPIR